METVTFMLASGMSPGGRLRGVHIRAFLLIDSGRRVAMLVAACLAFFSGDILAQAPNAPQIIRVPVVRGGPARPADTQTALDPYAAVIQPSEEATTLLRRAAEGVGRQDWKLAIDSFQRIVELPGEHVLTSDGQVYESARRHAHRKIAALPPAGLEAYRLVHDGEAAALLRQGIEAHRPELLSTVADRFLCTSAGDQAAFTLAEWWIDEGRFAEAFGLLQSTFGANGTGGIYPDSDLPRWAVPARMAICAAALGQRQRASALLKAAGTQPSSSASLPEGVKSLTEKNRLAEIQQFIARVNTQVGGSAAAWTCAMGGPGRDARQPAVIPTLVEHPLWNVKLWTSEPKHSIEAIGDYARRNHLVPSRQIVTDGQVLVVRREDDLLALDLDSFSTRWQTKARHEEASASAGEEFIVQINQQPNDNAHPNTDAQMRSDPTVLKTLHDTVGSGLSLAAGMVLAVEWLGDPPQVLTAGIRRFPGAMPGRDPSASTHPNRIVAYSLKDGSFLWKSDVSTTQQINATGTGPAETEFLAPPIPADGYLVAPCRMNGDLFAVLLDPATGRLARQIYLCGLGGSAFDSLLSLDPCLADGILFFPTGRELLIAVSTGDWSVRWAVRYAGLKQDAASGGWLPTPPVVIGDLVLLAPTDSDFLLAFDRSSGALRWQTPREGYSHIMGATEGGVWVAGKGAAMFDFETGRPVWQHKTADASGRACLSGDRVYVPTFEGLVALDARTGHEFKLDTRLEPQVLGNLLAWEGSLYSVSIFVLKKYPDLGRGYEQAVARQQENPADPSRALRLASLELLKQQPSRAIKALAQLPEGLKDSNPGQYQSVVQLRVRAMLDSVSSGETTGAAALGLLQEARRLAITPADALDSTIALGDHLMRTRQPLEAALQYLALAISADGDQMLPSESGVERMARGVAIERTVDAMKELSGEQAARFSARVEKYFGEAAQKHDPAAMLWLAESPGLGEVSRRAEVALGGWAASELRFEQAESYFLRALRGSKDKRVLAEAGARIASLYLEPDELHQPASAAIWLDRLAGEWGDIPLPPSVLDPAHDLSAATQPAGPAATDLPARQIASALRAPGRLDSKLLRAHQLAMQPIVLGRPGQATIRMQVGSRPLCFRGERTEPLTDTMMLMVDANKVEAHAVEDGKLLWPAELRLINDLAVDVRTNEVIQNLNVGGRSDVLGRARGVLSGQTMIVNTAYGIHAIGLLTGRRLWSRKFEPPERPGDVTASDACIWSHEGYLVSIDQHGHLEAANATQGDRVLWRGTKTDRRWAAVRVRGPYVVAVNGTLEQADVYRLVDGRYVGECKFQQEVSASRQVNITLYDDVICGPVSRDEIVAMQLAAPGVEQWRIKMDTGIGQIFKPTPNVLAIADKAGLVRLYDPASGKQILETRVLGCARGVIDGAIADGVLYVYGYQAQVTDPAADFDQQRWSVAAIEMNTGKVLWERGDLGARTFLSDEMLRCSSNAIPIVTFLPQGVQPAQPARVDGLNAPASGSVVLTVIDKKTGKPIGKPVETPMATDVGASRIQNVEVWPGRILVVAGSSYLRFPVSVEPGSRASVEPAEPQGFARTAVSPTEHARHPSVHVLPAFGNKGGQGVFLPPLEGSDVSIDIEGCTGSFVVRPDSPDGVVLKEFVRTLQAQLAQQPSGGPR